MRSIFIALALLFFGLWLTKSTLHPCLKAIPEYNTGFWNQYSQFHNCYAYAFRDKNINFRSKPQPGYKSGRPPLKEKQYTCDNFRKAIQADYPNVSFKSPCPCGTSAVFLALDTTGNFQDYHFYRQDRNGLWSHKPGAMPVQTTDYEGNPIYNPLEADRHDEEHPDINYATSCGFMCVPH